MTGGTNMEGKQKKKKKRKFRNRKRGPQRDWEGSVRSAVKQFDKSFSRGEM